MEEGDVDVENEADVLLSSERLSSDSPVMWPDQQHFCELVNIDSTCTCSYTAFSFSQLAISTL